MGVSSGVDVVPGAEPLSSVVSGKPTLVSSLEPHRAKRVLLAEDDEDLRSLMRAFLLSEGYEVLACGDGQRALQLFQSCGDIDLLITDMQMPRLTGFELAAALSSRQPAVPAILISGQELTGEQEQVIAENRWLYLQKPFSLPVMLEVIHEQLKSIG